MKKRLAALTLFAIIAMFGHSAGASPSTGTYRCDTWHRRAFVGTQYRYSDHRTHDSTDTLVPDPTNPSKTLFVIHRGSQDVGNNNRYGVVADAFWIEALGGGGYGSNGYPYQPFSATGEGGAIQGDVHPTEGGAPDIVNYSVWSMSLDDEGDGAHYHDTYTGACVSVAGQSASLGKPPAQAATAYNPVTQTGCDTTHNTKTANCWGGPTGNCDATGLLCDEGFVLPTHMVPHPVAQPLRAKIVPPNPRTGE